MVKWAGYVLFGMGILHGVMTFVLFGEALSEIWTAGLWAGSSWSMDMLAAFWFGVFTWLMVILGLVIAASAQRGDFPMRRVTGWSLVIVPVACGLFLPISGLWVLIIPGIMMLAGRAEQNPQI